MATGLQNTAAEDMVAQVDTGARNPTGWQGKLIIWTCIAWSLFQLYIASPLPTWLATETGFSWFANIVTQSRMIHLAFGLTLATLGFPLFRSAPRDHIPAYDWALAAIGISACFYLIVFRLEIANRPGLWNSTDVMMSTLGMFALLVAVYRALGLPLLIIALIFISLTLFGGNFEAIRNATNYGGSSYTKAIGHYWMQTEGVFGVALGVSTTMIFLFVLFGALLEKSGGGNWFIKVALSLLGGLRGGPAKAAVLASASTGMISGSSIANTVTTGTFTIPLMKRIGFSSEKAGAVEVASSTNGQLTPPVMGAAAFLMVEYVNISYIEVVKHAFLPAVVSYIALLYITHLESLKLGLTGLPKRGRNITVLGIMTLIMSAVMVMFAVGFLVMTVRQIVGDDLSLPVSLALMAGVYILLLAIAARQPDLETDETGTLEAPRFTPTLFGGLYFIVPIFVLVWNLMVERLSPGLSAFWATFFMVIVALTHSPIKALFRGKLADWGRGIHDMKEGLISGARNMIGIAVATGAAGIIVGTISLTGAHQIIGEVIETIAGDNIMILLILVAILSLILGMGLPTTANYIVVSSLMAPVIIIVGAKSGLVVPLIAVHMFVFYFGILADDTPPVGLAAYAAAAISGGDPIKTGLQGFGYDIRTALLPFMFIFNTDLLLIDVSWYQGIFVFIISTIAMMAFAAATQGYFFAKSRWWETIGLLLVAFTLFRPGYWLDMIDPPYRDLNPAALTEEISQLPAGSDVRLIVDGPDFDTGKASDMTIVLPVEKEGGGETLLADAGIIVTNENGNLLLEEPFPGTPFFERLSKEYDFYGDVPVTIASAQVDANRWPKELLFIPALLLLSLIALVQSRRMTQPAF